MKSGERVRIRSSLLILLIVVALPATGSASIIHVPDDQPSIQAGIDAAIDGDTILVSPGTYHENIDFFSKAVVVISSGGAEVTTIESAQSGVATVLIGDREDAEAELIGFTVTGSTIYGIRVVHAIARIESCIVRNNGGYGINISYSDVQVLSNEITENRTVDLNGPGGLDIRHATGEIAYNRIHANNGDWGKGACITSSQVDFHHNTVYDHGASLVNSYAVRFQYAIGSRIFNNTIANNAAGLDVTSLYIDIHSNIIAFNTESGIVLDCDYGEVITDNCFWDNGTDEDIDPDCGFHMHPLFVDDAAGDYSLRIMSPCINRGNPDPEFNDSDSTRNDVGSHPFHLDLPISSALGIDEPVMNVVSPSPTIHWTYLDTGSSTQQAFEVEVSTALDPFLPTVWDTGERMSSDNEIVFAGATLLDGVTYFYRVRVRNDSQWGDWRYDRFRKNSHPPTPVPTYPIGDTTNANSTQLVVTAVSDPDGDSVAYDFEIYDDTLSATPLFSSHSWPSTHSDQFIGLTPSVRYWWRARATDFFEDSDWSSWTEFAVRSTNVKLRVPLDYSTIQAAISAASSGDTIEVLPATYLGSRAGFSNISFYGKDIVLRSSLGPEVTILDCQGSAATPRKAFIIDQEESSELVIEGFTIRNGYATGHGGGLEAVGRSGATIRNCVFTNNHAEGSGGAASIEWCVNFEDCVFESNTADNTASALRNCNNLTGCTFTDNSGCGSVISIESYVYCPGSHTVSHCLFAHNEGTAFFASYYCYDYIIRNSTFYDHLRAVYVGMSNTMSMENCIITNHSYFAVECFSSFYEPEIPPSELTMNNCDVFGNLYNYASCLSDDAGQSGNISSDPLFCDPENMDFRIANISPCAGTGLDGENMGAFPVGCVMTGVEDDEPDLPVSFHLAQNHPNPFNPETAIEFTLPAPAHVQLTIYNSLGQSVRVLVDEGRAAGHHSVFWDGRNSEGGPVATGVYLYRIVAGNSVATRKMMLLK